jgi:hypothetical protein
MCILGKAPLRPLPSIYAFADKYLCDDQHAEFITLDVTRSDAVGRWKPTRSLRVQFLPGHSNPR